VDRPRAGASGFLDFAWSRLLASAGLLAREELVGLASIVACSPLYGVAEDGLVGGEVVDPFVVAEGDTNEAGLGVLDGPDAGVRHAVFLAGRGLGKDLDGEGALGNGPGIHVVELIDDLETGRNVFHDGMIRGGELDAVGAEFIVSAGAAADDLSVEFGPFLVSIPSAGVEHDDAFTGVDAIHEGFEFEFALGNDALRRDGDG
jgi:hypothetical protein